MSVVPDSIEPVEAWRRWNFNGVTLMSVNDGSAWKPGEHMVASCRGGAAKSYSWRFARSGLTLAQAAATATNLQQQAALTSSLRSLSFSGAHARTFATYPQAPTVQPPDGYGYQLVTETHDAPHENCTCGIYAAKTLAQCPPAEISGKVSMWGKVIPGDRGYRAEFAYPSELHVPAKLAEHPALIAYGVPIVVAEDLTPPEHLSMGMFSLGITPMETSKRRMHPTLKFAIALNLAAAALNLGLLALRVAA